MSVPLPGSRIARRCWTAPLIRSLSGCRHLFARPMGVPGRLSCRFGPSWLIGWGCSGQSGVYAWVLRVAGAEAGEQAQEMVAFGGLDVGAQFLLDADGLLQGLV